MNHFLLNIQIGQLLRLSSSSQSFSVLVYKNPPSSTMSLPANAGHGGFFPFNFSGTLRGAAACFYGFIGFNSIASTAEETKNPQKSIPVAIIISLSFISIAYDVTAPLGHAFYEVGLPSVGSIVTIGALFGLSTSLFG